jgi:hypothetical protein
MIRWNVVLIRECMSERGWTNANQLAVGAKLTAPVAARVLAGAPLERIEVATLERLALAFGREPWDLLDHRRSARRSR